MEDQIKNSVGQKGDRGERGPRGRDGAPGKDFNFEEHADQIRAWSREFAVKFSDLTADQVAQLRGERGMAGRDGRDGKDGKDFSAEDHRELFERLAEEHALKFSDLTADQIAALRGPRGPEGRNGKDFNFEEHRAFFDALRPRFADFTPEEVGQLKLRFVDLSERERDALKLKFEHLTEEERISLRGPRGQRGQAGAEGPPGLSIVGPRGLPGLPGAMGTRGASGRDGEDGIDGQDAPHIIDILIDKNSRDEINFRFEMSDGGVFETEYIKLPRPNSYSACGAGGGSGQAGAQGEDGADGAAGPPAVCTGDQATPATIATASTISISTDNIIRKFLKGAAAAPATGLLIADGSFVGQKLELEACDDTDTIALSQVPANVYIAGPWVGIKGSVIRLSWGGSYWTEEGRNGIA